MAAAQAPPHDGHADRLSQWKNQWPSAKLAAGEQREQARFRLHLVRLRTALKNRIHATLITFGHPLPVSDLFVTGGCRLLAALDIPEPWASTLATSLGLIDELERQIDACAAQPRAMGADHPDVALLRTLPGVAWVLGYTINAEIGDIGRLAGAKQFVRYTGLCPRVRQSGTRDDRGPLTKQGPKYLRWALIEAATHAARNPRYRDRYQRTRRRLGRQRGPAVARVELARELATAIWHMLTQREPFTPAGPRSCSGRLTTPF